MFINNKYTKWYHMIINNRIKNPAHGYTEKHHITPYSLGGSNDPSNIIRLTAREHLVCHKLLTKMTIGNAKSKMVKAIWMLIHTKNYKKISSREFAILRETYAESCRITSTGKKASNETKQKMSKASIGRPKSEETKAKMKIARNKRASISDEAHENLSNAKKGDKNPNFGKRKEETSMFGKHHSDKAKSEISKAMSSRKWWNNGSVSKRSEFCPGESWMLGRLNFSNVQNSGKKWWTNGIENKLSLSKPSEEYFAGRTY